MINIKKIERTILSLKQNREKPDRVLNEQNNFREQIFHMIREIFLLKNVSFSLRGLCGPGTDKCKCTKVLLENALLTNLFKLFQRNFGSSSADIVELAPARAAFRPLHFGPRGFCVYLFS